MESTDKRNNQEKSWKYYYKDITTNYHPAWSTFSMSWGMTALVIGMIPLDRADNNGVKDAVRIIGIIIWAWNSLYILIFYSLLFMSPRNLKRIVRSKERMYMLGAFSMDLSVWIASLSTFFYVGTASFVLWWIDIALALYICCYLFFRTVLVEKMQIDVLNGLEGSLIIHILPLITAANVGPAIVMYQNSNEIKITCILTSYILLGMDIFMSFTLISMYLARLFQAGKSKHAPNAIGIIMGPISFTGSLILKLANAAYDLDWPTEQTKKFASIGPGAAFFIGLICWGTAVYFFILSFGITISHIYSEIRLTNSWKFNLGYWPLIFPLGTLCFCTYAITIYTEMLFFYIMSWIFALICVVLSVFFHVLTIYHTFFNYESWWSSFRYLEMKEFEETVTESEQVPASNSVSTSVIEA